MKIFFYLIILIVINFILFTIPTLSQVENVPIINPIYDFLLRAETKGYLPNFSLSQLPLQRSKITEALKLIRKKEKELTSFELNTLKRFEKEFEITSIESAVVFYSMSDTTQVLSTKMFSDVEKSIYRYRSDDKTKNTNVTLDPLAGLDYIYNFTDGKNVLIGTLGSRLFGTLSNNFGYYLQITNAVTFLGSDSVALYDPKYFNNNKFRKLNSDADMSESHIAFIYDWFYASIGRETRLEGSGLKQSIFINKIATELE